MEKPLQWHPAFQAVLQIEFAEEFLKEYNLTDSPLRIDTLIVKMEAGVRLRKKIGRIFRRYNIIEYKGPKDSHTVNSFFKVNSYAGLLQSGTRREREIPPEEITITLVGNHYPRKLIAFLKTRYGVRVENPYRCFRFRYWCRESSSREKTCGLIAFARIWTERRMWRPLRALTRERTKTRCTARRWI